MNRIKKLVAVLLTAALMVPSMGVAAAGSPVKTSIANQKGTSSSTFTGKAKTLTVKIAGKSLKEGKDFVIVGKEPFAAGTHTLTIKGIGTYTGTAKVTYTIKKASKPVATVSTKALQAVKKPLKASQLKKKGKTINLGVKVGAKTKVTYSISAKKSLKKYIKVSSKGKVTLKKGIKKGTYKVIINIKGNKHFKGGKKTFTIKVK